MVSCSIVMQFLVVLVGMAVFFAGVFDRPSFELYDSLLSDKTRDLYAIVATSREKDIGGNIEEMLTTSLHVIESTANGAALLNGGATLYGSPEGTGKLALGLYFDDPALTDTPQWAVGWAVDGAAFAELQQLASAAVADVPIRAVRISPGPILKANIPWRSFLTPMIAPMLHWERGFNKYKEGGHSSSSGRPTLPDKDGAIALEVYVKGPGDARDHIDYVVLFGDTSVTWDDTFPLLEHTDEASGQQQADVAEEHGTVVGGQAAADQVVREAEPQVATDAKPDGMEEERHEQEEQAGDDDAEDEDEPADYEEEGDQDEGFDDDEEWEEENEGEWEEEEDEGEEWEEEDEHEEYHEDEQERH